MDEYKNAKFSFNRAMQMLFGHTSKLQKMGKTIDEVMTDERTQNYLRDAVKAQFRLMTEFNKMRSSEK